MPQMAPMSWLLISLFTYFFFYLLFMKMSYSSFFVKHSLYSGSQFLFTWKW